MVEPKYNNFYTSKNLRDHKNVPVYKLCQHTEHTQRSSALYRQQVASNKSELKKPRLTTIAYLEFSTPQYWIPTVSLFYEGLFLPGKSFVGVSGEPTLSRLVIGERRKCVVFIALLICYVLCQNNRLLECCFTTVFQINDKLVWAGQNKILKNFSLSP